MTCRRDAFLFLFSWLLIFALAAAGLSLIARDSAYELPGDGYEYLMMPVSLVNHGSTYVMDQDIEDAKAYYGNNIFDTIYRTRADVTLVEGSDGRLYAKHYGLYSVLCMPLRFVFHYLSVSPAKAFLYMNLVFWIAACITVQCVLKAKQWQKTVLMIFLCMNPCWFYLTWVHTEILIFSLVTASLVFKKNGKHKLSMLFMSLAAMNNLTLLVPCFFIGIDFILSEYRNTGKDIKASFYRAVPMFVLSLPGFIPVIRSYILFNSFSPVAAVASASKSADPVDNRLICALSYIFDPNQGMIIYTFLLVPVFFILLLRNFIVRREIKSTFFNFLCVAFMLFIVSQELHINCGMSYIMRYNVWILPFMAFFNAFNMRGRLALPVFSLSGAWTLAILVAVHLFLSPNLYLDYTPVGRFVALNFPSFYNPPVGIFYSRTLNSENYYCDYPVPLYDSDGNLRKLLLTPGAKDLLDEGEWFLYGPEAEVVSYEDLRSTNINGKDFTYVNFTVPGYHIISEVNYLDLSDPSALESSYIKSPVGLEREQTLVYGNEFSLLMHLNPGTYTGTFKLSNVFGGEQYIRVICNGQTSFEGTVSMFDDGFSFDFDVGDDYILDLQIEIPGALSPSVAVPGSDDHRVLSLYLKDFSYELSG